MSPPTPFNPKSPTIKRILKEASELLSHPDSTLHASPLDSNLFEWHFTLLGPPSTPYAQGIYHGRITLPPTYPLRPPSFRFLTPSGRFEVNREICLSISGHHEETWQPAWGIRTALWALRAFMEGGAKGQVGGMEMGREERERLAGESRGWRCGACGGRSGEEILREEGVREREKGKGGVRLGGGGVGMGVEVPRELRLGFRDEMMGERGSTSSSSTSRGQSDDPPSTKNPPQPSTSTSPSTSTNHPPTTSPPAHPHPTTTTTSASASTSSASSSSSQPRRPSSSPIPTWIDKAIGALVAGLAVMIVRKIAG